ncbi:HD-GYP domain-containing protein [Carboxydothermus hydrogenoformans]|uniref:HD domain protein n=1 Tax=Carboxydothermus hydrogenoformans (strain ATCC BAA-161 / DSM 6008 / Z-2901) TaxID=246194 RepID=Q3ADQ3_CARHZ|nr:HD domain-containing phosphohydrolase [Carboxydothermus hydrogenoformans]ABB15814.1 HD domain protein [Carboxydothermus hydrogenoformans Z-2901]
MLSINITSLALSLNRNFGLYEKKEHLYRLRMALIGLLIGKKLNLSEEEMKKIFIHSLLKGNLDSNCNIISNSIEEIICLARLVAKLLGRRNVCIFVKDKVRKYILNEYLNVFPMTPVVMALLELMEEEAFWFNLEKEFLFLDILKMTMGWEDNKILKEEEIKKVANLLTRLIENKDVQTREHSQRVARIALRLSEELKLSEEQIQKVELASLIHDIGKLAIPAKILHKPGKLTEREFLLVKSHPFYTYKLFETVDGLDEVAKWAGYHHEKLDGSGYPFKVKKEDLDIEARVIQVADITAALLEKRSYRDSMDKEQVIKILRLEAQNNKIDLEVSELTQRLLLEDELLKDDITYSIAIL